MTDYQDAYRRIITDIGDKRLGALATCSDNIVSCRTISFIALEGNLYFQTDVNSVKGKQIRNNSNVAVSFEEFEIIGEANVIGHPYSDEAVSIYRVYEKCYPSAAKKYGKLSQESLYCIKPEIIKVWKYTDEGAVIELLDIQEEKYERIMMGY